MKEEALTELRMLDSKSEGPVLRATFATAKTQYNLSAMLLQLPDVIKAAKEQIEAREQVKLKLVKSQETGEI